MLGWCLRARRAARNLRETKVGALSALGGVSMEFRLHCTRGIGPDRKKVGRGKLRASRGALRPWAMPAIWFDMTERGGLNQGRFACAVARASDVARASRTKKAPTFRWGP